jgi:hypothetical protein
MSTQGKKEACGEGRNQQGKKRARKEKYINQPNQNKSVFLLLFRLTTLSVWRLCRVDVDEYYGVFTQCKTVTSKHAPAIMQQ